MTLRVDPKFISQDMTTDAELQLETDARELADNAFDLRIQATEAHVINTSNPHATTKEQIGLGNVDNVSAADLRVRATHTGNETQLTWNENASPAVPVQGLTTYSKSVHLKQTEMPLHLQFLEMLLLLVTAQQQQDLWPLRAFSLG